MLVADANGDEVVRVAPTDNGIACILPQSRDVAPSLVCSFGAPFACSFGAPFACLFGDPSAYGFGIPSLARSGTSKIPCLRQNASNVTICTRVKKFIFTRPKTALVAFISRIPRWSYRIVKQLPRRHRCKGISRNVIRRESVRRDPSFLPSFLFQLDSSSLSLSLSLGVAL